MFLCEMGIKATKIGIAHCFGTGDTESLKRLINFALIQKIGRALRVLLIIFEVVLSLRQGEQELKEKNQCSYARWE